VVTTISGNQVELILVILTKRVAADEVPLFNIEPIVFKELYLDNTVPTREKTSMIDNEKAISFLIFILNVDLLLFNVGHFLDIARINHSRRKNTRALKLIEHSYTKIIIFNSIQ
jgi:hypothetical protein